MTKETTLYIKNMVCDRCVMAVDHTLRQMGQSPLSVELGKAVVEGELSDAQREALREQLRKIGFELLDDRRQRTIEQIKTAVIAWCAMSIIPNRSRCRNICAVNCIRTTLHCRSCFRNMPPRLSSVTIWSNALNV